jgi:glycerol uptake facilitator-like aquaporin
VNLTRRAAAECVATAFLVTAVVGSGIMAERLSGGNVALALLANAIATGGALVALILAFGPISGAHMNPAVTLALAFTRDASPRDLPLYVVAQCAGAVLGAWAAHLMFELPVLQLGSHVRSGPAQWFAEFVASFGLVAVVKGCAGRRDGSAAYAVAGYITGAYWFTASTSFANPAVTLARAVSDTFAGIRPIDVPGFVAAQLLGALAAAAFFAWLARKEARNDRVLAALPEQS